MKLYQRDTHFQPQVTAEQFAHQYRHAGVVSAEGLSLFFAKVQDSFASVMGSLDPEQARYVQETMDHQRAATLQAKQVKLQYFRHEVVSKPESFEGYYTEYLKVLYPCAKAVDSQTRQLLETLKMAVGTFINEYNDEKIDQVYGHVTFAAAQKSLPGYKKDVAQFFTAPAGKVKTQVEKVLKSMQDIEVLYAQVTPLAQIFTPSAVEALQQQVQSVTDLVDSLVQVNMTSGVLNKSVASKQHLIDAIHITAQYVEYYHALLAHWVFYCKAFNELTTALVAFPTQR